MIIGTSDLPSPPTNGMGWPWEYRLPSRLVDFLANRTWPLVSIVIPSFNQGEYLEQTIRSVLLQCYPSLQLIIVDGGSQDRSLEIIDQYREHIYYSVSEPDGGAAEALKKGFSVSTGQLMGWINSDDLLLPSALLLHAAVLAMDQTIDFSFGHRIRINRENVIVDFDIAPRRFNPLTLRFRSPPQETVLFRRSLYKAVGGMNVKDRPLAMDYELYLRMVTAGRAKFANTGAFLGAFRVHPAAASSTQILRLRREGEGHRRAHLGRSRRSEFMNRISDASLGPALYRLSKYKKRFWTSMRVIELGDSSMRLARSVAAEGRLAQLAGLGGISQKYEISLA